MSTAIRILPVALLTTPIAWVQAALAQATPALSSNPQEVVPTPAADHSGWMDIGLWGWIGIVVMVVILAVLIWHRRRR